MRMKGASLLWWYVISLWMSSFRVPSCDYIDILRYHLYFWEYLVYPYYPCVMVSGSWSFDSIICDSSSVVHLSYCDQAFACTSNRISIRHVSCFVCIRIDAIGVWMLTVFVFSLFLLFSSLSCSLSLSLCECWCVYIVCVYTLEVLGAVEYERSFTHCARY